MLNDKVKQELSALLDGEVHDLARAEELNRLIQSDPEVRAEYEELRSVKTLMVSLPEFDAPDFMATRVQGEIAARKKKGLPWLRPVLTMAAGFALCLVMVVGYNMINAPHEPGTPELDFARNPAGPSDLVMPVSSMGRSPSFSHPQEWGGVSLPEGVENQALIDFIDFANKAHSYSVMMSTTEAMSPDLPGAILVLDEGGGR